MAAVAEIVADMRSPGESRGRGGKGLSFQANPSSRHLHCEKDVKRLLKLNVFIYLFI